MLDYPSKDNLTKSKKNLGLAKNSDSDTSIKNISKGKGRALSTRFIFFFSIIYFI